MPPAPNHANLVKELRLLATKGVGRIREVPLHELHAAAETLDLADTGDHEPAPVLQLLREAADRLGGGDSQEQLEYVLGLKRGTELWTVLRRQDKAAEIEGIKGDAFRKKPQAELLSLFADKLIDLVYEKGLRASRIALEQHRHPADSRLAVRWVEQFESYYRLWTPIYALALDIEAAIRTYDEEPAAHPPWSKASTERWDPKARAREYARDALYDYAQYQLELKRFKSRNGGLWLFSSVEVEDAVADAIYRVGWENSFTRDDDALLRRSLADSRFEENDHFWQVLLATTPGRRIEESWQDLVLDAVGRTGDEREASHAWRTIWAAKEYCRLVNDDWLRIADWYRPGSGPYHGTEPEELYEEYLERRATET